MTRATVVIPNYNGMIHLPECLASLGDQSEASDVVVVDNGSSDESVRYIRDQHPWIRIVELRENRGFPAAVNVGIRMALTDYVVLLNNDTKPDRDWLRNLLNAMEDVSAASFGASKILRYFDPDVIDSAGDRFSIRRGAGVAIGEGEPAERYSERAWVLGASAAAAIYRRSLFEDIGYFDEDFFLLYEDVDVDLRAQLAGHKCLFVPDAIVLHKRGATYGSRTRQLDAIAQRNRIWVAGKTLPLGILILWLALLVPRVLWNLPSRLARTSRDSTSVIEPSSEETSYLRVIWQGIQLLPAKRRQVQERRRVGSWHMFRLLLSGSQPFDR